MPFGLVISLACHAALLGWAYLTTRAAEHLPTPDTPAISAELITPSEFLRLKQGSEDAKNLETKANDKPTTDDSKNDTKKPDNAPPPKPSEPPPQEVAKVEPPTPPEPAPEPAKSEPPPAPEPPKAEPPPGPTPDEQKLLEQKILDDQRAAEEARLKAEAEAKQKADEEAKKKAEEEAKKKAEEEARKKKLAEEARKKKLAEAARKKAEEAKKKFDPNKIASLLDKAPDDATPKALIDKDPTKKGQQAVGSSQTATALGKEAGTATGADTVLSAREQDLLKGMIKSQLTECWRLPGAGGGEATPVVTLRWRMKPDGSLDGEPSVQNAPSDPAGQVAAEAALRAVRGCQPFRLPPDQYDGWKDVIWVFDPRQML